MSFFIFLEYEDSNEGVLGKVRLSTAFLLVALFVENRERVASAPEVWPLRSVDLIHAELRVVDRVKVALLLKYEARVIFVNGGAVLRATLRGLARDGAHTVAGVDLESRLVCRHIQPKDGSDAVYGV